MMKLLDQVANIVGKGENAGYQHFLLSQNVSKSRLLLWDCQKSRLCGKGQMMGPGRQVFMIEKW